MTKKAQHLTGCEVCPLNDCIRVPGEGPEKATLVIVGEAPGAVEVKMKRPFVGPSGHLLDTVLQQAGLRRESAYITNAVCCTTLPPSTPKSKAVSCCSSRLIEEVRSKSPVVVLVLGKIAAKSLLGINKSIEELRGTVRWVDHLGAHVVVTYHPAYVLRNPRLHRDLLADVTKAKSLLESPERVSVKPTIQYFAVGSLQELAVFLNENDPPAAAVDVEVDSSGNVLCLGISTEEGKALVIPGDVLYCASSAVGKWLSRRKVIGHNTKFDLKVLRSAGITGIEVNGDTMLQAYVLNPLLGGHGLKQLVREHLDYYDDYSAEVDPYYKAMEKCPREVLYRYNAHDAAFTLMLYNKLSRQLDDLDRKVLDTLLYPASNALLDMECLGIAVDTEYLRQLDGILERELEELERELCEVAGVEFNPRSPKQLLDVMYKKLKLPVPARLSTDKKALDLLSRVCDHPFIELLRKYRERHKFHSTYVRALLSAVSPDGRVRTTFNLHTTVTGRLSSSNPVNLQNQPKTPEARNIFVATPGYMLIEADLKNAEVRGWAWYSRDENLRRAIVESGVDIHRATASLMWSLKPEEVTDAQRTYGKRLTFGTLYGMDAATLASDLGVSVQEAVELQNRFFAAYPRGREWIVEQQKRVRKEGVFVTPFGRKLRFTHNPNDPSEIDRTAVNYPIQSLCSDIALSGLIRLHEKIKRGELGDTRLLVTVHDSVLLETREPVEEMARTVKEIMEVDVLDGWIPFEAEVKIGEKWGSLEEC